MDIISNKGIIPVVKGGLGNQLFGLAASYVMSKYHDCPLYILESDNLNCHNIHKINYNEEIFKYFGIHIPYTNIPIFIHTLLANGYNIHENTDSKCFESWSLDTTSPGLLMMQYYQYYPPLEKYEYEIRDLIIKALNESNYISEFELSKTRAFIHIRRGDYLTKPDIHFIQPIEYYQTAYSLLTKMNPTISEIVICSDDITWAKAHPFFNTLPNVTFYESTNEIQTLHMMTTCHGGAVCANSTFSWWGAFLGPYSMRAPVIVPQKWINQKVYDLFPKEWIVI